MFNLNLQKIKNFVLTPKGMTITLTAAVILYYAVSTIGCLILHDGAHLAHIHN